ncbi:MotA/TolQ/ExbB proton channel family protein [uncultured Sanguibacteroides sp.]|uniref:MotA/TolQ/ExbB proton channel family protein n=1 Tax=uncultured Sanguibacteroides sp. TaxID=1635151 RepID=UPI0025D5678F|nr:MotA/TolQ/ExbB proton channel family protein [uncultured Sanguibacteroides sp.]
MNNWILQIAAPVAKAADMDMSLWGLVVKGGWLMIPIFILSIMAIYIACERFWIIRKTGTGDEAFMQQIQEKIQKKDIEGALTACDTENTPLAKIIRKGILLRTEAPGEIRESMENTANYEVATLEKGLATLATCAGTAPMIGFLGTVVGMVQAFYDMAMAGNNIDISLLSRGIYTAMITTVAGLIVGIIGYLAYNYLVSRIDKIVLHMERYNSELIDSLIQLKKNQSSNP